MAIHYSGDRFVANAAGRITDLFAAEIYKRLGKEGGGRRGAARVLRRGYDRDGVLSRDFGGGPTGAATFESSSGRGSGVRLAGEAGRGGRPESADVRIRNRFATLRCCYRSRFKGRREGGGGEGNPFFFFEVKIVKGARPAALLSFPAAPVSLFTLSPPLRSGPDRRRVDI